MVEEAEAEEVPTAVWMIEVLVAVEAVAEATVVLVRLVVAVEEAL